MRSTDDRMAAVKQKTQKLKQEQIRQKNWVISFSSAMVCLVFIVGAGAGMPGILSQMNQLEESGVSKMASIFYSGSGLGYVIIALLSFSLGICVALLTVYLQRKSKDQEEEEEENHD